MTDTAKWTASPGDEGYKVTYSKDEISISITVADAESIEPARRKILIGFDAIKGVLAKNPDRSQVELPPITPDE